MPTVISERSCHDSEYGRNVSFAPDGINYTISTSSTFTPPLLHSHFSTMTTSITSRLLLPIKRIFTRTFLPLGYPDSVRKEYLEYQLWDSIQGLSSYLRGVLTTQSVLIGAGVGSIDKTAMAAALVWIIKDGTGMLGSLVFAYLYSDQFEVNVKEFRLFADVLNNIALLLQLLISAFPNQFLLLSCLSAISSSLCGLIAGATKARISAHFAKGNHLADITAKESTQETAVTLVGLLLGYIAAKFIGDDLTVTWIVFAVLLIIHQVANYILVRTLIFDTLNPQRCWILMRLASVGKDKEKAVWDPDTISHLESLSRPIWLSLYGPRLGCSVEVILEGLRYMATDEKKGGFTFESLAKAWEPHPFIIGLDSRGRYIISLSQECNDAMMLKAYLLGLYLSCKSTERPYSLFNISKPDLKRRYLTLVLKQIPDSLQWYDKYFSGDALGQKGWDVEEGKSRVGSEQWRFHFTATTTTTADTVKKES